MYATRSNSKPRSDLLKQLTINEVDFRVLTVLKNNLFDSDNLQDMQFIPISVWNKEFSHVKNDKLAKLYDMILAEIKVEGEDKIDLGKFSQLVDCYTYLPFLNKKDKNDSSDVFRVMSSGMRSGVTVTDYQPTPV